MLRERGGEGRRLRAGTYRTPSPPQLSPSQLHPSTKRLALTEDPRLSYFSPPSPLNLSLRKVPQGSQPPPTPLGGGHHPCWVPVSLPAAANKPFIKYPLVPSAGVCHLSPARTVTGKYKNQTHHSRISLLESTCHNMCMLLPLQFLQVIEDSVWQRGKCHKTSILIYSTVYLEGTEFIFLKSEASFPT